MLIFGGTKGIGQILAQHYKNTFKVSVTSRQPDAEGMQQKVNVIKADVTREKDVESAFDLHYSCWGKTPDVVINCAARQVPIGNTWEIPLKEFDETLKINLLGSFIVSKAAVKRMIPSGHGSIIMFSGGGSAYSRPHFNAYGSSKTGVVRLVEIMADELITAGFQDITINAFAPGAVKTRMMNDILDAGPIAGKKELEKAAQVLKNGGTTDQEIISLMDFFMDHKINKGISGRLIHVREDYHQLIKKYGKEISGEIGKLRRIPLDQNS